jgi:HAMP domain-containing protein
MGSDMGGDQVYRERRLQQLNAAQHKSMVADTDKLLKLVTELNTEIANTNPDSLTPQQLRKIAEIEKLAHNVKDKMRMSVKGSTDSMEGVPVPRMGPR